MEKAQTRDGRLHVLLKEDRGAGRRVVVAGAIRTTYSSRGSTIQMSPRDEAKV